MLVLSRKVGESLVIGENVTVTVLRVDGRRVSVGIEAPPEMKILRGELKGTEPKSTATTTTSKEPS